MRWPMRVLVVFLAAGVLAGVRVGFNGGGVRVFVLGIAVWVGWATMAASIVILLGTALERLRKRPFAVVERPVARRAALIAAGALLVASAVFATFEIMSVWIAITIAAVGIAAIAWRSRSTGVRSSVVLLVLTVALFDVPRELGYVSVSWYTSHSSASRNSFGGAACPVLHASGVNPDGSGLTGDIGELVFPTEGAATRPAIRYLGRIDAGWLGCMFPLHKTMTIDATISYILEGVGCSGTGTITMHIDLEVNGVASCRNAREIAAQRVRDELIAATNQL